jgi:hypothetical protein
LIVEVQGILCQGTLVSYKVVDERLRRGETSKRRKRDEDLP